MSTNVRTIFYVRKAPCYLGQRVEQTPSSEEALQIEGLDSTVYQTPIQTEDWLAIPRV